MTESFTENDALEIWSTPECPFVIGYSRKALDDIRLAVVDAFFSLPRGGAEIGGILLGRVEEHQVQILDYAPIECEHAFGPAFTLSPGDQVRLGDMLRQPFPGGLRPVGWYHSHTRSEIALSATDLDIHNRYFPERWQVALVLRPSTLQPTQAGFFFREPDGSIHAENSYQEFVVEALPLQQLPTGIAQAAAGPIREIEADSVVLTLSPTEPVLLPPPIREAHEVETPAAAGIPESAQPLPPLIQPEAVVLEMREPNPYDGHEPALSVGEHVGAPATAAEIHEGQRDYQDTDESEAEHTHEGSDYARPFVMDHEDEPQPRRGWVGIAAGVAIGLVLGIIIDPTRSHGNAQPAAPTVVSAQPQVPDAQNAALRRKNADLVRQVADLMQQNGTLRQRNVELSKQQADSTKQQAELTKEQGESGKRLAELRQQRDDLAKANAKLKSDLAAQAARAVSLQQQVEDLRRQQQRRRLSIQSSDPLP